VTSSPELPTSPNTPAKPPGIGFILITFLLIVLGFSMIIPVLPTLVKQLLGRSESESAFVYGLIVAAYAGMQFLFAPLLGALSDRFGRRPVLLISTLGMALDYVLMSIAPVLALIIVGRLVAGLTAASITTCNAYVADITKPEDRAKRYGLIGAVFGIGFAFGPLLGGALGEWHLRAPFMFSACLAFINFFYGLLVLPESLPAEHRREFSWKRANPLGALLVVRRHEGVLPLLAVAALLNLAQFSLHVTWVFYTSYRFGWQPLDVGKSLAFVGMLAIVVQGALIGPFVRRFGEVNTLLIGVACASAAFAGYGLASHGWMMYAAMIPGAFGGLVGPAAQAMLTRRMGPKNQGLGQGMVSSLGALCQVLAPILGSYLFGRFSGPHAIAEIPGISFLVGSTLCVVALMIAVTYIRPYSPPTISETETSPTPSPSNTTGTTSAAE
jgi:MFS transporter, DHA1 family, tetracycline resistance protein